MVVAAGAAAAAEEEEEEEEEEAEEVVVVVEQSNAAVDSLVNLRLCLPPKLKMKLKLGWIFATKKEMMNTMHRPQSSRSRPAAVAQDEPR